MSADMQRERERRNWEVEEGEELAKQEAEARRRKQKEVGRQGSWACHWTCLFCISRSPVERVLRLCGANGGDYLLQRETITDPRSCQRRRRRRRTGAEAPRRVSYWQMWLPITKHFTIG